MRQSRPTVTPAPMERNAAVRHQDRSSLVLSITLRDRSPQTHLLERPGRPVPKDATLGAVAAPDCRDARPFLAGRLGDNGDRAAGDPCPHFGVHNDRPGHGLLGRPAYRLLSRKPTSSGPADCNGATPVDIRSMTGAVPTAVIAMSARACGPLRAKDRASHRSFDQVPRWAAAVRVPRSVWASWMGALWSPAAAVRCVRLSAARLRRSRTWRRRGMPVNAVSAAIAKAVVDVAICHTIACCMASLWQTGPIDPAVRLEACIAPSNPQLPVIVECASECWPPADKPFISLGGLVQELDSLYSLDRSSGRAGSLSKPREAAWSRCSHSRSSPVCDEDGVVTLSKAVSGVHVLNDTTVQHAKTHYCGSTPRQQALIRS
jgi:hypothetical protein